MSEDGCLRDAVFNTMQVESGDLEDSFPGGLGILRGLTIANGHDVSMGDNRVEDLALPTQETDAASKYYVDSIFPARFIDWVSDGPPQNIGENTSPQFVNVILTAGLKIEGSTHDSIRTNLNAIDPDQERFINLANSDGTLIPFDQPSTTTISATPEEINLLSGITLGNISANDILSVDSNRDITGIRNISIEHLTDGTMTISSGNINNVITIRPQNIIFEGTTTDNYQTTFSVIDPTEDRTINLANSSGTLIPFSQPSTTIISATPEEVNYLDGTTPGTATGGNALAVDSNKDISGIRNLATESYSDGTITISSGSINNVVTIHPQNIIFEGTTTDNYQTTISVIDPTKDNTINLANSSGTLIPFAQPSTTSITATPEELNFLSGTTLGTATANDILSIDANRDITGIHNMTIDGILTNGIMSVDGGNLLGVESIAVSSFIFEGSNIDDFQTDLEAIEPTQDNTINLANSSGTLIPFAQPSTTIITATPEEVNYLSNITLGTATASKPITTDSNRDITGIHNMTIDGTFTNGAFTFDGSGLFLTPNIQCDQISFKRNNDDFKTELKNIEPTADRTIKLANSSGTLIPFAHPSTTTITCMPENINDLSGTRGNIQTQIDSKMDDITFVYKEYSGSSIITHNFINKTQLIFSSSEGFELVNSGSSGILLKQNLNTASLWRDYKLEADGGSIDTLTTISPTGIDDLTFVAGNNISLSFEGVEYTSDQKLKIEVSSELTGLTGVTIDGENGLKVKNGEAGPGFVEFYEDSNNGTNKITLQGESYLPEDVNLILPGNGGGYLVSTGDSETVTDSMLSVSGVSSGSYGSSTSIPVITVNEKGRITSATTSNISTDLQISSDSGNGSISLMSDILLFTGGDGINTTITGDTVVYSIDNTVVTLSDEQTLTNKNITNSNITLSTGNTIDFQNADVTFANNQINGSKIEDNTLSLGKLNTIPSMKILGNDTANTSNVGEITLSNNNALDDSGTVISTQFAIKHYIDSVASGLDVKESCIASTTENISLDNTTTTIDDVTLVNGNRILVKNQTTLSENGIYIYSDSGPWSRSSDFNNNTTVTSGSFSFVES